MGAKWKKRETKALVRLAADRLSARQIAAKLKRPRNGVISKANRIGVRIDPDPATTPGYYPRWS